MRFDIYPAIDLRQGRVVRLQLGDPERQTVFSDDPIAVARRWRDAGATWLHVVNLDGAFLENSAANWAALAGVTRLDLRVQYGGGLRSTADIARAFDAGVTRVVIGTAALEDPALVNGAIERYGAASVAVGLDAQDGLVRTHGWQKSTNMTPLKVARTLQKAGVQYLVFTDIGRDGLLAGVNVAATTALAMNSGLTVIASGGVRSIDDVRILRECAGVGVGGVIIGRALYEGYIDLAMAIRVAAGGE